MTIAARAAVPGVYIRHVEPEGAPLLPPLQVAAFVGFAERGPVNVPVRVEQAADLERLLGRDTALPVAMHGGTRWLRPYLRRAAESFLENGGRRCWVVRVAGDDATRAVFTLDFTGDGPGTVAVHRQDTGWPLEVRASSEGTWANRVELRARLRAVALRRTTVSFDWELSAFWLAAADRWSAGDLLRVTDDDGALGLFRVTGVQETEDDDGVAGRLALGAFLPEALDLDPENLDVPRRLEVLTFDLEARKGDEPVEVLSDLGFAPEHPRYAFSVLRDALYLDPPAPTDDELTSADGPAAPMLLPVGLPSVEWTDRVKASQEGADDFQEMSPDLFAPSELDELTRDGLLDLAVRAHEEAHRAALGAYVRDPVRLRGLLSLVPVDEVALVALPDVLRVQPDEEPDADLTLPANDVGEEAPPCTVVGFAPCAPGANAGGDAGSGQGDDDGADGGADGSGASAPTLELPEQWRAAYFLDDDIRRVQRAAARLCQLRGDMVAVLATPRGRDASAWRWRVMERDLDGSYAAFYHPWVRVHDEDEDGRPATRLLPPDGPACGAIARRERFRGVWVAPANEPLRGILGLDERLSLDDWAALLEDDINVVRPFPGDFRIMSARTLSRDPQLSQLNVRRLLIALKKALYKWGMDFVFESHTHQLRSALRHRIERALDAIHRRGAFAGATAEEAFQVVVDETVNPMYAVEAGRLLAVVKVAPSWPMEFLEVHLVRTGEGLLQLVEA